MPGNMPKKLRGINIVVYPRDMRYPGGMSQTETKVYGNETVVINIRVDVEGGQCVTSEQWLNIGDFENLFDVLMERMVAQLKEHIRKGMTVDESTIENVWRRGIEPKGG